MAKADNTVENVTPDIAATGAEVTAMRQAQAANQQTFAAVEVAGAEDRINNAIASLAGQGALRVWSSIKGDDFDAKMAVAAAVQEGEPLRDHLGETLELQHYVVQGVWIADKDANNVQKVDPETGELKELYVARIVLITADGQSFASISTGIFKALENLVNVLGEPHTWPKPVKVKAVEQGPAMRRYLTLKLG